MLSACVGSEPSLGLSQTQSEPQPIETPEYAVLGNSAPADAALSPQPDPGIPIVYDGVGVPVQAPRTPVVVTDIAVSNEEPVIEPSSQLTDATETQVSSALQQQPTSELLSAAGAAETPVPQADILAPDVQQPAAAAPEKPGFFGSLFGYSDKTASRDEATRPKKTNRSRAGRGDDDGVTRIASAHQTARRIEPKRPVPAATTAETAKPTPSRDQLNTLPGVKSNSEIFGIDEAEIREEIEANSTQLAAVGGFGRLSPNGLRIQHEKVKVACLKPGVIRLLKMVERRYGSKPIITSAYRSPKRNRNAGGARNSQHILCKAVDIQVEGVSKWNLAKFLRTLPGRGGVGTYCRTKSVHLDIGSLRDWHHPCRRSKVKKRKKA